MSRLQIAALLFFAFAAPPGRTQDAATGERRVVAILVSVPGKKALTATRAQVAVALFAREDSVAARFRKMSYGQLKFSGGADDVVGPFSAADPGDFCKSGLGKLADAADAAARAAGVDVSAYEHAVYVIPQDMGCWWTGLGIIGGRRVWVKEPTVRALDHELGHNLGMNHALFWENSASEASDLMGTADFGLNAPHVVQLGWLDAFPGKVVELSSAQELTLETLEADPRASARPKIVVARPSSGGNAYYLSYRADLYSGGVNVHVFNGRERDAGFTRLVRVLKDGETFSDGPLRVRQISHSPDAARLAVDWNGSGRELPAGGPPAAAGTIQSLSSSKCLDVARGSKADGAPVVQWTCHAGPNQQWRLKESGEAYEIVNVNSGKCLEVRGGAGAVQQTCADRDEQRWTAESSASGKALKNLAGGLCLDLPHASADDGVSPTLWRCQGSPNQEWRLDAGQ